MPFYEWECDCGFRETVVCPVADRDGFRPEHDCGGEMRRLVGGKGLLYFEEGRARSPGGMGGKPITSHGERQRRMRAAGVSECGDYVPPEIAANPKSEGMKRYLFKPKRRWY